MKSVAVTVHLKWHSKELGHITAYGEKNIAVYFYVITLFYIDSNLYISLSLL